MQVRIQIWDMVSDLYFLTLSRQSIFFNEKKETIISGIKSNSADEDFFHKDPFSDIYGIFFMLFSKLHTSLPKCGFFSIKCKWTADKK